MTKIELIKKLNLEPVDGDSGGLRWRLKGHGIVIRRNQDKHTKKLEGDFFIDSMYDYIVDDAIFTVNPENGDIVIKEE